MISNSKKGFTLIEMMICIAIVGIISTVVMFSYSAFSDSLALSSAGQEIAVEVRQAQVYGLSVKENTVGGSGQFNNGYGVHISLDDPTNYYIFVDLANPIPNNKYDGNSTCAPGGECVEKMSLRSGVSITAICGAAFGNTVSCPLSASIRAMDIIFVRPNPDAQIRFLISGGSFYQSGGTFQTGQIILTSAGGKTMKLTIQNTGQISLQ